MRLLGTGVTAVVLTFFSQIHWHNPWSWWTPMIAVLALTLFFACPRRVSRGQLNRGGEPRLAPQAQVLPEPGEQFVPDGAP
jgi:hypothetical protein